MRIKHILGFEIQSQTHQAEELIKMLEQSYKDSKEINSRNNANKVEAYFCLLSLSSNSTKRKR